MDTKFQTLVEIKLKPIWHNEPPLIKISCFDRTVQDFLQQSRVFTFSESLDPGTHFLKIELLNKKSNDTNVERNLDKAVVVESITINGITDRQFIWQSKYFPQYHEPWLSQQHEKPPSCLLGQDYLGWNGIWFLEFSTPAFIWIHQSLAMGWIYD